MRFIIIIFKKKPLRKPPKNLKHFLKKKLGKMNHQQNSRNQTLSLIYN